MATFKSSPYETMSEERIRRTHEQRIKSRYYTGGVFPRLQKDIKAADYLRGTE